MGSTKDKLTFQKLQELTNPVEGFLGRGEGEVLYHLACKSNGKIVELGSWKGKSTIWLGKGSEAGGKHPIYAIDPHAGTEEHRPDGKQLWTFRAFQQNISHANIADYVIPIVKPPLEGIKDVPGRVSLVFIDGTHDYEELKADFDHWLPKLTIGGTIAFHDSFGSGVPAVRRLVHDEIFKSPLFRNVRYINGITYATKVDETTFKERLGNHLALLVKVIHEKSRGFPQPLRSLAEKLIHHFFQRKWLKELK